jgi:carbon storage regulator
MLVLSRFRKQSLVIDDNIVITIQEIAGGRVKLGVEAPKHIEIHRMEVWKQKQEAATDAVEVDGSTSLTEVKP